MGNAYLSANGIVQFSFYSERVRGTVFESETVGGRAQVPLTMRILEPDNKEAETYRPLFRG